MCRHVATIVHDVTLDVFVVCVCVCNCEGAQVYQQFIMGMLNNFDSLPLDRIHNMLKMFMSDDQCTQPHSLTYTTVVL